ncbi:ATP-binding protein, partial [bacterium]
RVSVRGAPGDAGRVVVEVADNGIGFEPQHAERIFEPFQRLHRRTDYEGSGLGLALCARIAARHGGTLRARSAPGEGSVFTVVLPRNGGA